MKLSLLSTMTVWTLLSHGLLLEGAQLDEDQITRKGVRGDKVTIVKRHPAPRVSEAPPVGWTIPLPVNSVLTNVPVNLAAYEYECLRASQTGPYPIRVYCFEVRTRGTIPFVWSCWTSDFSTPHSFQVLNVAPGAAYACYINEGVHLFRLDQQREPEVMRKRFWDAPTHHPDALPLLSMSQLFQTVGRTNFLKSTATTWKVYVDQLSEEQGQLTVTLHADTPLPKYKFALKESEWVFISKLDRE